MKRPIFMTNKRRIKEQINNWSCPYCRPQIIEAIFIDWDGDLTYRDVVAHQYRCENYRQQGDAR